MNIVGKHHFFRKGQKITDHYTIGEMYNDDGGYFSKARVGIHKKTGIERAII